VVDPHIVQRAMSRFKRGVLDEPPVVDQAADKKPRRRFKTGVLQVSQQTPVAEQPANKKPR
ncbi:MAG: hypothetical protein ACKPKO_43110, partial [Candidatus Fonsibacter sp.]